MFGPPLSSLGTPGFQLAAQLSAFVGFGAPHDIRHFTYSFYDIRHLA